jgi:hypothetical protein
MRSRSLIIRATRDLATFAREAFDLTLAGSDGRWNLYRVALDP